MSLKDDIAAIVPGTDPLTADQLETVFAGLSALTVEATNAAYRVTTTALSTLPLATAVSVLTKLNGAAAQSVLVNEALIQLRGGGLELAHPNTQAQMAALFTQSEIDAINSLDKVQSPKYPHLCKGDIITARAS